MSRSLKLASLRSVHAPVWNPRVNRRRDAGAKMTKKEGGFSARSTFSLLILVPLLLGSFVLPSNEIAINLGKPLQ